MAARKLQSEIDRTLKKVSEGVELFESIYDKMQASTNQTQKEKQELDLKTQIKKLQRLRDQIKTWVASNDIKDKSSLLDNRRLIETQMEKFKACEKEMKTKAFSKEGLIQATRLDPKEQEKEDAMQWLQQQVEELQMQVESTEAEVEALQGSSKKKNKGGAAAAERLETLEGLNERRKWHINRLELILRLTNNGSITADKVNGLREDVQYFVTSNTEDEFEEDEGIYEDLNLDEVEGEFGFAPEDDDTDSSDEASEDMPPPKTAKKHDEDITPSHKRDDSPILKKAGVSLAARKHSVDTKPPPNLSFAQQPMSSVLKASLPQQPATRPAAPTVLPPIRYAAAAAAAVNANPSSSSASSAVPVTPVTPSVAQAIAHTPVLSIPPSVPLQEHVAPSPSLTQASVTSPVVSSAASISQPSEGLTGSPQRTTSSRKGSSVSAPSPVVSSQLVATQSTQPSVPEQQAKEEPVPQPALSPLPQQIQQAVPSAAVVKPPVPILAAPSQQQTPAFPPGVKIPLNEQLATPPVPQVIGGQRPPSTQQPGAAGRTPSSAFPGSLSDLVVSFENVKQKALRVSNLDQVHKMLEGGHINVPQPQDTDKPKYYVPRNPYPTPAYYPQQPHPTLASPAIFSQLDVETLFYIFYYLPGTYQQYLAAKELKRQSWRFHVKYLTWFQRHSEPQAITEDYEQGVYVYFDWEGSWCQRKKGDFRFEYRYLSED
ncbi:hypothetical protein EST38_g73 [Candolleomyces aberdarensis]|uniref:General negative regulator of transcription subunit n=1 Tax=Candolleomyces aberdarensis TaxID=2316362 RepID=A0A4Q2DYG8_9AGAR|nr:hypothetical protein EST38_g73 [Candolleomyces aberdarensis]